MPGLDGLRAVAILIVMTDHAFPRLMFPGGIGVEVFFVLSGFLITRILLKQYVKTGGINLRRFYFNRAVRLWPPLIVMVVVTFCVHDLAHASLMEAAGASLVALTYTSNVVETILGRDLGYLSHTWSLAMEEQFYLVWPALLLVAIRRRAGVRAVATVAGALGLVIFLIWAFVLTPASFSPAGRAGGLFLGCLLAAVTLKSEWSSTRLAYISAALFVGVLVLEATHIGSPRWTRPAADILACPIALEAAFGSSALVRWLSIRPLVYVGLVSYGIYLWHYPLYWILYKHVDLPAPLIAIIGAVIAFGLAVLTREFVEKPTLSWRDKRNQAKVRLGAPPTQLE